MDEELKDYRTTYIRYTKDKEVQGNVTKYTFVTPIGNFDNLSDMFKAHGCSVTKEALRARCIYERPSGYSLQLKRS